MHHGQIEVLWVCPSCRELSIKVITRSTWRLTVHAADPLWLMCGTRGPDFQQVRKFEQEFQQHSEASCSTTRFQLSFSGKSYKVWGEHSSRIFGGSPRNKRHPSLIWPWFCHFFFLFFQHYSVFLNTRISFRTETCFDLLRVLPMEDTATVLRMEQ